jgi:hypothetical protein
MKKKLLVRFANEGYRYQSISIDPKKVEDVLPFPKEVFFTVDGVRVACDREDWDRIQKEIVENKN